MKTTMITLLIFFVLCTNISAKKDKKEDALEVKATFRITQTADAEFTTDFFTLNIYGNVPLSQNENSTDSIMGDGCDIIFRFIDGINNEKLMKCCYKDAACVATIQDHLFGKINNIKCDLKDITNNNGVITVMLRCELIKRYIPLKKDNQKSQPKLDNNKFAKL